MSDVANRLVGRLGSFLVDNQTYNVTNWTIVQGPEPSDCDVCAAFPETLTVTLTAFPPVRRRNKQERQRRGG